MSRYIVVEIRFVKTERKSHDHTRNEMCTSNRSHELLLTLPPTPWQMMILFFASSDSHVYCLWCTQHSMLFLVLFWARKRVPSEFLRLSVCFVFTRVSVHCLVDSTFYVFILFCMVDFLEDFFSDIRIFMCFLSGASPVPVRFVVRSNLINVIVWTKPAGKTCL